MRYRIKEYIIQMLRADDYVQVGILVPSEVYNSLTDDEVSGQLDAASLKYVTDSIRLIADETRNGYVLVSTGQKGVVDSVYRANGQGVVIQIKLSVLIAAADGDADDLAAINAMANSDQFTIEMDWGDEPTGLSGGDAAEQVKDFFHIVKDGDTVKVITEDGGEEVVVPVELATEQEVKGINDDVWGALYGYGKVTVTIHSLMRTGAETTQDLASVIYVDPEKTWSANGYPTLYDDEGNAIDTTTNPTEGAEVFNYQIQSES